MRRQSTETPAKALRELRNEVLTDGTLSISPLGHWELVVGHLAHALDIAAGSGVASGCIGPTELAEVDVVRDGQGGAVG